MSDESGAVVLRSLHGRRIGDIVSDVSNLHREAPLLAVRISNQEGAEDFRRLANSLRRTLGGVPVFGSGKVPRGELWLQRDEA